MTREVENRSWTVKIYHYIDSDNRCRFEGVSEKFVIIANDQAKIRSQVETYKGSTFSGDKCRYCG